MRALTAVVEIWYSEVLNDAFGNVGGLRSSVQTETRNRPHREGANLQVGRMKNSSIRNAGLLTLSIYKYRLHHAYRVQVQPLKELKKPNQFSRHKDSRESAHSISDVVHSCFITAMSAKASGKP